MGNQPSQIKIDEINDDKDHQPASNSSSTKTSNDTNVNKTQLPDVQSIIGKRKREMLIEKTRKKTKTSQPYGILIFQGTNTDHIPFRELELHDKKFRIGLQNYRLIFDQSVAYEPDVRRVFDFRWKHNFVVFIHPEEDQDLEVRINSCSQRNINVLNSGDVISIKVANHYHYHMIFILQKDLQNTSISVPPAQKTNKVEQIKSDTQKKLQESIIPFDKISESLEDFPYYLCPRIKQQLLDYAYLCLKKTEYVKYLSNTSFGCKRLLLAGVHGTELYMERLAKALAKHLQAFFLSVDLSSLKSSQFDQRNKSGPKFKVGDRVIYDPKKQSSDCDKCGGPTPKQHGVIVRVFDHSFMNSIGVKFDTRVNGGHSCKDACDEGFGYFVSPRDLKLEQVSEDEIVVETIHEIIKNHHPIVVFIKQANSLVSGPIDRYNLFKDLFEKITTPAFIIGSAIIADKKKKESMKPITGATILERIPILVEPLKFEKLSQPKPSRSVQKLFPNKIIITPPTDGPLLIKWNEQIKKDIAEQRIESNCALLKHRLAANHIIVKNINKKLIESQKKYTITDADKIIAWTLSKHLQDNPALEFQERTIIINDLNYGLEMFGKSNESKKKTIDNIEFDNDFEKNLASDVISPSDVGVKFDDIGALDKVKETLIELVMLPLKRPELFKKGNLTKPVKGILLFGPPGTGKTMLAKAIATESNANFINVSMSSLGSKWFGESEKYVRALFTLAAKLKPCILFIDEVDSILGRRSNTSEHEGMRKLKNEFMSCWDGMMSEDGITVLAASNRPFDLDDAVLRRLPRRLLVDLPNKEQRKKILQVILKHEDLQKDVDLDKLAEMTEGYSGSDLHNMCKAAAYYPIREILKLEKSKKMEKHEYSFRPLTMKDFIKAQSEVGASISENALVLQELRKWNDMYGENGGRNKDNSSLYYFL